MAWLQKQMRVNRDTGKRATYFAICWRTTYGKVETRALGFCTATDAKKALKVVEGKLAAGEPIEPAEQTASAPPSSAEPREPPLVPTLREYLDAEYLPVVRRDKSPKTAEGATTSANALKSLLGSVRLDEVSFKLVDRYITTRKKLGRRSRTIILELRCLRQALQHAADSGVIPSCPKLPSLKDRDRRPHRFLTAEESKALLAALKPLDEQPHIVTRGAPPIRRDRLTYVAVLLALNTGLRRNEILTRGFEDLRWDQGPHGTLIVGAKPELGFAVKTRRDRAVPLTPELAAELRLLHAEAGSPARGLLFPSPKDPSRPRKEFRHALAAACERAGIPVIHPHGLRHTWASRLAMGGVDRSTLLEVGGWKEGRMLDEVYAHVTAEHTYSVMAKMGIGPKEEG